MRPWLLYALGAAALALLFHYYLAAYRYMPPFQLAEQFAYTTAEVQQVLGGDVRVGRYPRGEMQAGAGTADLKLPVRGSANAGTLRLVMRRSTTADWRVVRAELTTREGVLRLATRDSGNIVDAQVRTARGFALYQRGLHEAALAVLDSALADDSRHGPAHYWRGYVLEALGDYNGARSAFQAAVALNSNDSRALRALGVAHGRLREYELSLHYLDRAIAADSAYAAAYYVRAITRGRLGDERGAAADLAKGCELGSDDACVAVQRRRP